MGKKKKIRRGYHNNNNITYNSAVAAVDGFTSSALATPEGLLRREYMAFRASVVSELAVPAGIAIANGGLAASLVKLFADYYFIDDGAFWGVVAGIVVTWGAFAWTTRRLINGLFVIEEYGDEEEEEEAGVAPIRVSQAAQRQHTPVIIERAAGKYDFVRFGVADDAVAKVARHVLDGGEFTQVAIRKVAGQTAYQTLRPEWLNAGMLREANERGKAELTPTGRAVLTQFLAEQSAGLTSQE